jgi:hypothetical protein
MILLTVLMLLVLPPVERASADMVYLTEPTSSVCLTSPHAEYSVINGGLKPVHGEFTIAPQGMAPILPRVAGAASAQPGDLVRVYLTAAEPLDRTAIELRGAGRRLVARAAGFLVTRQGEDPLWCLFLGIPSNATPGTDELTLTGASGTRSWISLQDFAVTPRTFPYGKLSLTRDMTQLLTVPDPKKTAESLVLYRTTTTPHPDALYESGTFAVPFVGARRTSGYGDRREYDYSDGRLEVSIHYGVDIASPAGTPVPACGRGRVVLAAYRILTGNTVIVEHLPGLFSIYYHMTSLGVKVGDLVEKGAVVGTVGMTGFATGPHLHWEVQETGIPVDPDRLAQAALLDKEPAFPDIRILSNGEGR